MSSSTSNSRKSFKYPPENFVLDILHLAEDMFCRKKFEFLIQHVLIFT